MRLVTIYSLVDPRDNIIKYIGKTVQKDPNIRYKQHISAWKSGNQPSKLNNWIESLARQNLLPIFNIEDICNEENWEKYERGYIALLKACGADLKNSTNGGAEAPPNRHSPEARAKRSKTMKKKYADEDIKAVQSKRAIERHLKMGHRIKSEEERAKYNQYGTPEMNERIKMKRLISAIQKEKQKSAPKRLELEKAKREDMKQEEKDLKKLSKRRKRISQVLSQYVMSPLKQPNINLENYSLNTILNHRTLKNQQDGNTN